METEIKRQLAPKKATPVALHPKMTMAQAFRRIAGNCLDQIQANEEGVRHLDAESLHQMRVGVRRFRALLDLFSPLLAPPSDLEQHLEWLAGEFGPARDWDVLAHVTAPRVTETSAVALPLVAAAQKRAETHHSRLAQLLQEARYAGCMQELHTWLLGETWAQDGGGIWARKARKEMLPLLNNATRRLRKRARKWEEADAQARHRVRMAAKKARYAIEFFADLLPERQVKASSRLLADLQESLGRLNDAAVADGLLVDLCARDATAGEAASFVRGYLCAEAGRADRGLGKLVKKAASLRIG
ncbi:CHAD domain-containing protein [Massilia endophytica]|uniref:CHAD domain-containing protein n=1 Tax=Massilia endophytica TaxID=2899220 RepID=UPI001E48DED6|nr:CHAD domain-containing protein [Massilia endophytica]UGQ44565.1 CHAD domain-containing protein [Massilia endophytica]